MAELHQVMSGFISALLQSYMPNNRDFSIIRGASQFLLIVKKFQLVKHF